MSLNITTPLADQWERVPEQYKQLVREGKMSHAQALSYAVKPQEQPQQVAKKSLDTAVTPKEEYGAGVAMKTGATRAGQAVDAIQAAGALSVADAAEEARLARKESLLETFQRNLKDAETEKVRPKSMTEKASDDATSSLLGPGLGYLADKFGPEIQAVVDTARQKATIPFSDKGLENVRDVASASANKNIEEILAAKKLLDSLPKDQYTPAMVDALNRGDWLEAAKNMPASTINQMIEEVPTLAVQAGIVGGTALATRNPQATAAAARVAGAAGGFTELGSDFEQVYSKLSDEDKKDPKKVKAAMDTAVRASSARALIEGSLPGVGTAVSAGKPLAKTIATNVASQFAGDAGGEMAASNIKGDNASFGEIVAEGLGGVAGTAVESSVEIYQQGQEIKKLTAEFDKAQAELEGKTVEAKDVQSQTKELEKQVESVSSGEPVVKDMFSGEDVPAEQIAAKQFAQEELQRLADEAGVDVALPPLSKEQQMEVDNRTVDVLKKQEAGKAREENKNVETLVEEELTNRSKIKEAQAVVDSKYDIINVQDIAQEARQRLKLEQDAIANKPFNKTSQGQILLPEILAKREAVRLPEIKEEVKNERLAKVEQAASFLKQQEEADLRQEVTQKVEKEVAAKAPEQAALPLKYEQQPQPKERGYTGEPLTEQQKVAEVADLALKKEAASLPPEEAKVLLDEAAKAQKTFVAQEKKQEKAKASVYAKAESGARASILQEVIQSMPNATPAERSVAAARKMVNWKRANPQKNFVSEDTGKVKTLTEKLQAKEKLKDEKAKKVKAGQEQKAAEKIYESFEKEALARGLPKEEARVEALDKLLKRLEETESDAALPKEADTTLRDSLRSTPKKETKEQVDTPRPLVETNEKSIERVKDTLPGYSETLEDSYGKGSEGIVEVLQYIATTDGIRRDYGRLAAKMWPIVNKLNIKFEFLAKVDNPKGIRGQYDPNTNTISIADNDPETVMHEVLHAITWHVLNLRGPFKDNSTAKAIRMRMNGLKTHMANYVSDNRDKFTAAELDYIDNHALTIDGQLGNVDELLAYTLTSAAGQQIALKIPAREGRNKIATLVDNIMNAFIREIGRIFGYGTEVMNTAVHDVTMLGIQLLDLADTKSSDVQASMDRAVANTEQRLKALPNTPIEPTKPRPVLKRTSKVVSIFGKEFRVLNHKEQENIVGVIKDALTAGHGSRVNVTESLERARGLIGEYLQRAKARFDTIEKALKNVADKQGLPLSTVQDNFTEAVAKIEAAADDAKVSLSNSLARNYGDAASAYFANRAEIDLLTDKIIQERLDNPAPFTEKEAAVYTKMKNEVGKYYTRAYASNLQGVREEYAKTMLEAYEAKQKGRSTIAKDKLASIMEAAIDTIEHAYVVIPDTDVLLDSSLSKLRTLAATWDIKVAENDNMSVQDRKDAFIEALEAFRQDKQHMDPDFTAKRALALAIELIKDVEGSPIVSYVKGARADRTVVEAREQIPEDIRKFLGEYEDVALKGLTTVLKQAQFVFQSRALGEILNSEQAKGEGSKILSVEQFTERGYSPDDWVVATGESFGPIQGKYVEQALYNRLKEMQEVNTPLNTYLQREDVNPLIQAVIGTAAKGWMGSMSIIKQGQLVFNPVNAAYNLAGGPSILLSNGAFGKKGIDNVWEAFKTASKLIAAQGSASVVDPEVSRMIRNNQVDSAYLGSLRGSEMDKVKDLLLAQLGEKGTSPIEKGKRTVKEKTTQAREVYAMMDVVWKIAAYYHRVDVLTEFHKLNGDNLSPDEIDRLAAADNSAANFSYSHVPTMVKAIERAGPSYILPFIYESFRAPLSSMLLGMSDIKAASKAKTPEARAYLTKEGAKRTLGAATSLSFASVAMHAGASLAVSIAQNLLGDDEEERNKEKNDQKLIERLRPFMADYEKHDKYFVMGRKKNGDAVLFNFSRTDPFDVSAKLTRMLMDDADAEEYGDYFKGLFIKNRMGASILDAAGAFFEEDDGKRAKNTKMENWARPDFIPQDWPSVYETLSDMLGPKSVKAIDTILPSWPNRALDSRTEAFDIPSAMLKYGGGSPTTVDIAKNLEFAVMDYDKSKKAASELLKSKIQTNQMLKKEEYAKAWIKATEEEKEAFNKLAEKYQAIQSNLGYSKEEAAAYLKAAKLDEGTVNSLLLGTYRPENSLLISKRSMKTLSEDILKDKNPGTRARNARNYNAALEAIEAYNLPVKE